LGDVACFPEGGPSLDVLLVGLLLEKTTGLELDSVCSGLGLDAAHNNRKREVDFTPRFSWV